MPSKRFSVVIPDEQYFWNLVPCRAACPVHTDARGYVIAISEGRYEEAYRIAREPNPFASICGRVCNAPCQMKCRRGAIDESIAIRALKRFVCERFGVESESPVPLSSLYPKPEKAHPQDPIAIIGAGPAGLSCAHDLALLGYPVTVFEAQGVAGGMLRLGVPEYRLPRQIIQAEIDAILNLGVQLKLNHRLGKDFFLEDLWQQGFKAIFIGIGAHQSRELNIEGAGLDGVFKATDFLLNVNLGYRVNLGEKVIVIGGGNVAFDVARTVLRQREDVDRLSDSELKGLLKQTRQALEQITEKASLGSEGIRVAMDVAREALRHGAREVQVYCLESREEIPADKFEIEEALLEGIQLHPRYGPKRILGENGKVTAIEMIRVKSVFDSEGRFNPSFIEGSEQSFSADSVVLAIGQKSDLSWIKSGDRLEVTPRGMLKVDSETLAATRAGVFAGGDVAFGPRIIIDAVAEGKRAARSIETYLQGQEKKEFKEPRIWIEARHETVEGYEKIRREDPPMLQTNRRIGVAEVELSYEEKEAQAQGRRCLRCHIHPIFDGAKCVLCGGCVDICPENCLRLVSASQIQKNEGLERILDETGKDVTAMIMDETKCIRCGLCAQRCPTNAITMEQFQFFQNR